MRNTRLKLSAKFQSSVTLSCGEGRGEVLVASSFVEGRVRSKSVIFLVFALFIFSGSRAQVQSKAFNLTLKALLSHSMPEVTVPQLKEMSTVLLLDAREKARIHQPFGQAGGMSPRVCRCCGQSIREPVQSNPNLCLTCLQGLGEELRSSSSRPTMEDRPLSSSPGLRPPDRRPSIR